MPVLVDMEEVTFLKTLVAWDGAIMALPVAYEIV